MERRLQDLAANVRAMLSVRGMTPTELAVRAGVAPKTVNNVLNARHAVQADKLVAVADALGVELWQLFMPGFPADTADDGSFSDVVRTIAALPRDARKRVAHIAELESRVPPKS